MFLGFCGNKSDETKLQKSQANSGPSQLPDKSDPDVLPQFLKGFKKLASSGFIPQLEWKDEISQAVAQVTSSR